MTASPIPSPTHERPRAGRRPPAALLKAVEAAPPNAAAEAVGDVLGDALGARDVSFLIADYSGQSLIRLSHSDGAGGHSAGRERAETVPLAGTPQGEALLTQDVQVVRRDGTSWVYAPVTSRGEAVGVLELVVDGDVATDVSASIAVIAHALAYVVIVNRRFTDLFEWGQRTLPLSLEAEIQHRLLPGSYTCEGGQFTLAGWLEPAGACWNGPRRPSTLPRSSRRRGTCIHGRPCSASSGRWSRPAAATCATTRRCCASTGTAAGPRCATRGPARTPSRNR
ncbi:hypothetical protein DSM112329_01945 [Paraconexibacter sp. AEG42_29]|uniref:GAF domain-containing protein n=1 Tax=Paraconexibacter sp. AEG42_29 TaxID=2997339 RepID=A0AAU7ATU5_9ACTN